MPSLYIYHIYSATRSAFVPLFSRVAFCVLYLFIYVAPRIGRRNLRLNFWPCSVLLFGLRPIRMRPEGECGAGAQHKHVIVQLCMFVVVRYMLHVVTPKCRGHLAQALTFEGKSTLDTFDLAW